jgi:hypothetical protein
MSSEKPEDFGISHSEWTDLSKEGASDEDTRFVGPANRIGRVPFPGMVGVAGGVQPWMPPRLLRPSATLIRVALERRRMSGKPTDRGGDGGTWTPWEPERHRQEQW